MGKDGRKAARVGLLIGGAALALGLAVAFAPSASAADTTPPFVIASAPADGGFVNINNTDPSGLARVEVSAVISDAESGLAPYNANASLYLEGTPDALAPNESLASVNAQGNVAIFDLFFLPDGRYRLVLTATDNVNNTLLRESSFTVDITRPVLWVWAPASTNTTSLNIRIDARDNGSGMVTPVYLVYRSTCSYTKFPAPVQTIVLPGRIIGEAAVPVCIGTQNEFTVTVYDAAGNSQAYTQDNIACDLAPPKFATFAPKAFSRVVGTSAFVSVIVSDDTSGPDPLRIEYRYSLDGGVTWVDWENASTRTSGRSYRAEKTIPVVDGATVAVEWRAWDRAGNGPAVSSTQFFYVNGPPFIESVQPGDGTVIYDYNQIRLFASADDPDVDNVTITVSSDKDGVLGRADGRAVRLSMGIHNITFTLDDGHGHIVHYTTQVQVVPRPPPDPRFLFYTAIIAGAMLWAAYAAYSKDEKRRPRGEQSLAKTPDPLAESAKA